MLNQNEGMDVPVENVEVTARESLQEPKKSKRGFMLVILILLAIIAVVAVRFLFGGAGYGVAGDLILFVGEDKTFICYNNGTKGEIDGNMYDQQFSLDGLKGAVLVNYSETGGTLYYVSGTNKPVKIADDVYNYILSDSGNVVAYFTDYDQDRMIADLNLYDGKGGTSKAIDREAFFGQSSMFGTVISPDGKTVFYLKNVKFDDYHGTFEGNAYISANGNPGKEFKSGSNNIVPVAVADRAKYLYYAVVGGEKDAFMVQSGINTEANQIGEGNLSGIFFNKDYSQVVFNETTVPVSDYLLTPGSGTVAVISVNGGNSRVITNDAIDGFIIPVKGQHKSDSLVTVYGFKDFANKAFNATNGIFILNEKFNRVRVASNSEDIVMSENGKRIFYRDGNLLKIVSMSNPNKERSTVLQDMQSFIITSRGNFYYVDFQGELYRQSVRGARNGLDGVWIAEFVNATSLRISEKGTVYFLNNDKDLFTVNNTKKNKVAGNVNLDIDSVAVYHNNVFYSVRTGGELCSIYRSGNNAAFKLFASDLKINNSVDEWEDGGNSGYYEDAWDYGDDDDDWDDYDYYGGEDY